MEISNRWLMIGARALLAVVFLLNGFGVINQAIPAKEMIERGVPPAIRSLRNARWEISGDRRRIWTGARRFPAMVCLVIVRFSVSGHIYLAFLLAGGWHSTISRAID